MNKAAKLNKNQLIDKISLTAFAMHSFVTRPMLSEGEAKELILNMIITETKHYSVRFFTHSFCCAQLYYQIHVEKQEKQKHTITNIDDRTYPLSIMSSFMSRTLLTNIRRNRGENRRCQGTKG